MDKAALYFNHLNSQQSCDCEAARELHGEFWSDGTIEA